MNAPIFAPVSIKTHSLSPSPHYEIIDIATYDGDQSKDKLFSTGNIVKELTIECDESNRGLLYQINEAGITRGFLLGTMHLIDEKYLRFRTAIREGIEKSTVVFCERIRSLNDKPFVKPVVYRTTLSNGSCAGRMDQELLLLAVLAKKRIQPLEEEVVDPKLQKIVDGVSLEQIDPEYFEGAAQVWGQGNLAGLTPFTHDGAEPMSPEEHKIFWADRNVVQAEGILAALSDKSERPFAIIGGGHLLDLSDGIAAATTTLGVISILQQHGYQVFQI